MRRPLGLVLLLGALVALLAPSPASAARRGLAPVVGVADQKTTFFTDPLFTTLGMRTARVLVPWDALDVPFAKQDLANWMAGAKAAGIRPLVTFGHSRKEGRQKKRPSPKEFQRQFRRIRVNYPWVTDFATWNEPNHCGEPLCNRPDLAARYYNAIVRSCPTCTILAGELLDQPNMVKWVRAFRRGAAKEPRHWGLHNYIDANRFRTSGTRALLAATKGELWLTETGGIVQRRTRVRIPLPEGPGHAGRATRWLFDRLLPLSSRIKRVYLYHWDTGGPGLTWDSALIDYDGTPRTAYRVLRNRLQTGTLRADPGPASVPVPAS